MKKSLLTTSTAILFVVSAGFSTLTYACGGTHSHYGDNCEKTCSSLSEPLKTICYFGATQHKGPASSQVAPGMGDLTPALGTLTPSNIPMIPLEK